MRLHYYHVYRIENVGDRHIIVPKERTILSPTVRNYLTMSVITCMSVWISISCVFLVRFCIADRSDDIDITAIFKRLGKLLSHGTVILDTQLISKF